MLIFLQCFAKWECVKKLNAVKMIISVFVSVENMVEKEPFLLFTHIPFYAPHRKMAVSGALVFTYTSC